MAGCPRHVGRTKRGGRARAGRGGPGLFTGRGRRRPTGRPGSRRRRWPGRASRGNPFGLGLERVAVQDDEVGELARLERADLGLAVQANGGLRGVQGERVPGGQPLARAEHAPVAGAAQDARRGCRCSGSAVMTGASEEPATVIPARCQEAKAYSSSLVSGNASANPSPRPDRKPGWLATTIPRRAARAVSDGYIAPPCSMRCRRGLPGAGRQDRGVGVQHGLDRPVALGVDADLEAAGVEVAHHRGQLVAVEVQDARAVRRDRVACRGWPRCGCSSRRRPRSSPPRRPAGRSGGRAGRDRAASRPRRARPARRSAG